MTTPPDLPQWHVNGAGIREETTLSDSGTGLAQVYVVPYVIDSGPSRGHQGTVRVTPDEFANPERVRQAIETLIHAAHQVGSLDTRV